MKQMSLLVCLAVIPAVARADTVAFWRFGEQPAGQTAGQEGPIRDASGFGNHGRLLGRAKYVTGSGSDGTAIEWTGSGLIEVPDAQVFDFQADFTIEAMVRTAESAAASTSSFAAGRAGKSGFANTSRAARLLRLPHWSGPRPGNRSDRLGSPRRLRRTLSSRGAGATGEGSRGHGGARAVRRWQAGGEQAEAGESRPDRRSRLSDLDRRSARVAALAEDSPGIARGWIGAIDFVRVSDVALDVPRSSSGPDGTTAVKILAANRAAGRAGQDRGGASQDSSRRPVRPPLQHGLRQATWAAFPRDFEPHVQLFVPDDQLGARSIHRPTRTSSRMP